MNPLLAPPTVTPRALAATVGPLQGAAERLGRITDRLPRASRSRT